MNTPSPTHPKPLEGAGEAKAYANTLAQAWGDFDSHLRLNGLIANGQAYFDAGWRAALSTPDHATLKRKAEMAGELAEALASVVRRIELLEDSPKSLLFNLKMDLPAFRAALSKYKQESST